MIGINPFYAVARPDQTTQFGAYFGERHDLAGFELGVILQMGALAHETCTDKTYFRPGHSFPMQIIPGAIRLQPRPVFRNPQGPLRLMRI